MRKSIMSAGLTVVLLVTLTILIPSMAIQSHPMVVASQTTKGTIKAKQSLDPAGYWSKTYGGAGRDVINDVKVLPDGDIIAVGYTNSGGAGGYDALVMKLSPNGSVIWAKTYGGRKNDKANAVALTKNGDIVVVGWTESFGAGRKDAWVFELSSNGRVIWRRTYGGKKNDVASAVTVTKDDYILIAGWSMSFAGPSYIEAWVLKLSPNGSVMWTKLYEGGEEAKAIALTPTGNLIIVGTSWYERLWVTELDTNGRVLWQRSYMYNFNLTRYIFYNESDEFAEANSVVVTETGNIIVAGITTGFGAGGRDIWVLRLDPNGSVVWQKTYGSSADDGANALAVAPNGNVLVAGYSNFGLGGAWILRLAPNGSVVWTKFYEGGGAANAVTLTKNGGVIVAGGSTHAWILKLPLNGKVNLPGLFTVEVPPMTSNCTVRNIKVEVDTMKTSVHPWNPRVSTRFSISQGKYWAKTYWRNGDDIIRDVRVLPTGDIIAVGYTNSGGAGGYDALVMKLSPNGGLIWAKTYGGPKDDTANAVAIAPNGDVIAVGYTNSSGAGWDDVWVLRLSPSGDVMWAKTYGGHYEDVGTGVTVSPNGDIIVAGKSESFGGDFWILKLAPNGSIIWQKTYSNPYTRFGQSYGVKGIAVTSGGDIMVEDSGWWLISKSSQKWKVIPYVWISRLDPKGNVVWSNVYKYGNVGIRTIVSSGVKPGPVADGLALTSSGNIVVVGHGYINLNVTGERYVMVMKLSENGDVMWAKTYDRAYGEASSVAVTPNDDIMIAGWIWVSSMTDKDVLILRLNSRGGIEWQKSYMENGNYWASSVAIAKNDDVILAGGTSSFSQGGRDIWIMRLPSSGDVNLPCLASIRSVSANLELNVTGIPVFEESLNGVQIRPSVSIPNSQTKPWSPRVSARLSTAGEGSKTKVLNMTHLALHFLTPSNVTKRVIDGRTLYVITFRYDMKYNLPPKDLVVVYSSNVSKIFDTLKIEKVVISRPPEPGVNHSVVVITFGGYTGTTRNMGNSSSPRYRLFFDVNIGRAQSFLYWLYENGVLHTVSSYNINITPTNILNYLMSNDTNVLCKYWNSMNHVDIAFGRITNDRGNLLPLKDILTSLEPLKGVYTIKVYVTVPSSTVLNPEYFKVCVVERKPYQPITPTLNSSSSSSIYTSRTANTSNRGGSTVFSTTTYTSTSTSGTSTSSTSSPTRTGTNRNSKKKGICGPVALVALALIPLLMKRKR